MLRGELRGEVLVPDEATSALARRAARRIYGRYQPSPADRSTPDSSSKGFTRMAREFLSTSVSHRVDAHGQRFVVASIAATGLETCLDSEADFEADSVAPLLLDWRCSIRCRPVREHLVVAQRIAEPASCRGTCESHRYRAGDPVGVNVRCAPRTELKQVPLGCDATVVAGTALPVPIRVCTQVAAREARAGRANVGQRPGHFRHSEATYRR